MAWLKCAVLIGIIGVSLASENLFCYFKKFVVCSQGVTDVCATTNNLAHCINDSALSCSLKDDKDVESLQNFLSNEACKEGTEMNKNYKEYKDCITGKQNMFSSCEDDLTKAITDLALKKLPPEKLLRESLKLGCKFNDTVTTCTLSNVKKVCGDNAESFLKQEQNSGINQLSKRLCDYLNGARRISSFLPIWVIQGAMLAFISKWFMY